MNRYLAIGSVAVCLFVFCIRIVAAQANPIICGTIIEGAFDQIGQAFDYSLELDAGTTVRVQFVALGEDLSGSLNLFNPVDQRVASANGWSLHTFEMESGVLGAPGSYTIQVMNSGADGNGNRRDGGIGVYTLYIGCTLLDGTIIAPGDVISENVSEETGTPFSGIGFPGLAPVDFANVVEIPLISGTAMTGVITPTGSEIVGFNFTGNADQLVDLTFARLSGNLNLGIVVLSSDNHVIFQASLVASEMITTRLRLPAAGDYTIGVFRIDLLPPTTPEGTAFQITATLN